MDTSALWLIILTVWIFVLQNKISDLQALVNELIYKKRSLSEERSEENIAISKESVENEPFEAVEKVENYEVEDPTISSVEEFKESYDEAEMKDPSKLVSFVKEYFTGGNLLVRIGGVVLFFGLSFLVKYAAEHSVISMEMRLIAIAMVAVMLILAGWKLKGREGAYGQILQGLGIAMLYLVIYGAAKFYALLSLDMAFLFMFVVVVTGSILAVIEDSLPLAIFATAGGFLVPILTSSGDGSHVLLFSYYAVLNFGLFGVAWYRSWRLLNVLGFLFTFVIAGAWGVLRYTPEFFSTTEPFLLLYFVMYLTISILFTLKHTFEPKNFVDGTLVFGLPLVAFPLQVSLVSIFDYGEAYSAVVLGSLYVLLFQLLKNKERAALLSQTFLALGIVFYTIAIPYIFDADVSAALWSLESAAIIWVALKQKRVYARYFGMLLLFISLFVYPESVQSNGIVLSEYLGYIIVIISSFIASYFLNTYQDQLSAFERYMPKIFMILAIILWFMSTPIQLMRLDISEINAWLFSLFLAGALLLVVSRVLKWRLLIDALQGYVLLGILFFFIKNITILHNLHPFGGYGFMALGTFIVLNYFLLYQYAKEWKYVNSIHVVSFWFVSAIGIFEFKYQTQFLDIGDTVNIIASAVIPILFSSVLLFPKRYFARLEQYRSLYQFSVAGGLLFVLLLWELVAFKTVPDFTLLTYLPLLNLLDLTQIFVLLLMSFWIYRNKERVTNDTKTVMYAGVGFMVILLASVVFARAVHSYGGIEYTLMALWGSDYFQTGISILWSAIAIVLMFLSKRYTNRLLWLTGFGLLIVVVLKLFFIELANAGTIERIISFIVVGSLLLIIGYFVPLPPNAEKEV